LREAQWLFGFCARSAAHHESARGFDIDVRGRIVLKAGKAVQGAQ
jgi:hypothetical protein